MKAVGCLGLGSSLMLLDEELGGTEKFYTLFPALFSPVSVTSRIALHTTRPHTTMRVDGNVDACGPAE